MTKKLWFLTALLLTLAALYVVKFSGWLQSPTLRIISTSRPLAPAARSASTKTRLQDLYERTAPVIFGFDRAARLTRVKVVAVSELKTNKYPQPVWLLVSDSNSPPLKVLSYGLTPAGMRLANKGQIAQPLVPGLPYRIFIEAGDLKGQHDFKANPARPAAQTPPGRVPAP